MDRRNPMDTGFSCSDVHFVNVEHGIEELIGCHRKQIHRAEAYAAKIVYAYELGNFLRRGHAAADDGISHARLVKKIEVLNISDRIIHEAAVLTCDQICLLIIDGLRLLILLLRVHPQLTAIGGTR